MGTLKVKFFTEYEVRSMTTISVCLGSACHLRGANGVLQAFQSVIEHYKAHASVEMAGNFCQGNCTEGVVVQINDEIITNVSKDKVHDIFVRFVLNGEKICHLSQQ